ncbi:protein timeless homolog [Anoplophora glabripennis]|uniref:protein timeless homolog n=1 Tax=Anoplophora glabripennis TaxID=217634 RepID=UPI00087451E0|nr:protein timeless homolog [Anoplophora glabripennis]
MSDLLSAEIIATCDALGYFDHKSNKYYADSNTLETVKDLIRFLRRDDENHDVRRQLGETKVLQTDLLPLLKSYWEETDLFDVLLRLIVNLTTPALILWNEELPTEKTVRNHYLQIEEHLQSYKEAFADEGVWAVLSTRLSKILEIDYVERGDENSLIIERILILIRNVLYVPADSMEKRPDNDASVHDQVLWALHQSGMLDIMLYITSSSNEQAYYMHILEILSFMLREQRATELAGAALQRSEIEKVRDEAELLAIRLRENNQKQKKVKMFSGTRHSRFGGTFVVQSMKSISDNDLIYHKPLNKLDALDFDVDKKKPKTPKNRLPIVSSTSERRSAFTIRLFLKEFCVEFLNGAYNTLMYHAKDNLARAKAQAHDESYYLWALRFFMEFNRCYKFEVKLVSETMSVQAFHYVQQLSENYFDLMQTDKSKLRLWSRRLHLALLAYRELFLTLNAMDRSPDGTVRDSSKVIKSNIFYVPEYREFVLTLLVTYDELKMSDSYLSDLIETQHVFLKMFEAFCGGREGSLVVQKKTKGKKRRNKKAPASVQPAETSATAANLNLEGRWDEAAPQLSIVLERGSDFTADAVPFDAASDVPIDEQKADAMKNVQKRLRSGQFEGAIGLLRAAREVWPENDSFGSNNMAPEEEFLALRDIFFADLGENNPNPVAPQQQLEESEEEDYDDDEEEGPQYSETDFKFEDFTKRLPHPKIVRACGLALARFETNSVNTNHCIVKLLHRIAFDCKMYVMVFQVSIFRSFQRIFQMKELPQNNELVTFATYIIRQFLKVAETNKMVFMEALFWKSTRDAYEIEQGYGSYRQPSAASWTEDQENELRQLMLEYRQRQLEEDVVGWIVNNLIDNTRTRRAVLGKLKEMSLLTDDYKGKKKSGTRVAQPQSWGAEEETQLRELYEEFKDATDPLGCIMPRLEISRPKNRIIEKMLVMGLVQDKKELWKKRVKGPKSGKPRSKAHQTPSDEDDDTGNSSLSEDNSDLPQTASTSTAGAAPRRAANKNSTTTSRKKSTKKKQQNTHVQASKAELVRHLLNAMETGLEEALGWFKESLSDAIEDFEDGSNEGIPLVPIMDYAEAAMENVEFQRMLKAFGICQPFDEQEAYWRIPGHLTASTLNSYCTLLQEALDKTLTLEEDTEANTNQNDESDDDEDIFDKLRGMTQPPRNEESTIDDAFDKLKKSRSKTREIVRQPQNDDSSDDDSIFDKLRNSHPQKNAGASNENVEIETTSTKNKNNSDTEAAETSFQKNKARRIMDSDEEDENAEFGTADIENEENKSHSETADTSFQKRKTRRIMDSDDEDEDADMNEQVEETDIESNTNVSTGRNIIESDSEEENKSHSETADTSFQKRKTRRIMDSDEEDEDADMNEQVEDADMNEQVEETDIESNTNVSRGRNIIESDSEEEGDNSANTEAGQGDGKRLRSASNSDSEKPTGKRSRVMESDDDE